MCTVTKTQKYPGFVFPPGTPLYPSHEYVERYHRDFAAHFELTPYIRFNHTVVKSSWVGNSTAGHWDISVCDHEDKILRRKFDHLVVASGRNQHPRIPTWPGQEEWLTHGPRHRPQRQILHSFWYRGSKPYSNRSVIVVGAGASGRDIVAQIISTTKKASLRRILQAGTYVLS